MSFGGAVDVIGGEGNVLGPVVTGKPYSADAITESLQVLADGNRIAQRNETRLYRDGEGRTRREQRLTGLGPWSTTGDAVTIITINDPVANVSYFLDPTARTARQSRPYRLAAGTQATWEAGVSALPALPPPGTLPQITVAPLAGAVRALPSIGVIEAVNEELGEQVLEGMLTRGARRTQTIPAGTVGNDRPIEIVAEQWYADDVEAVVQRRNFDPRFGETTYRLVNVIRGEPSPDLFAVPQGYDVQTQTSAEPAFGLRTSPSPSGGPRIERNVFFLESEPAAGRD
jgi:hypothetical protein